MRERRRYLGSWYYEEKMGGVKFTQEKVKKKIRKLKVHSPMDPYEIGP
jgi:hypothetical protein